MQALLWLPDVMTANPNTACKPLPDAQEEHIMYCTMSAWQSLNNAAWKGFHPRFCDSLGDREELFRAVIHPKCNSL